MNTHAVKRNGSAGLIGLLSLAVAVSAVSGARAQDRQNQTVPLKRIILFTSGVGYFEHQGTVDGDAVVELKFNTDDVNDLLKSLVVQDLGGGQVSTVTYGSRDPITRTLKTFAIDLTEDPSLAELLQQIRGEKVEVDAPNKVTGTIVGVEQRSRDAGDGKVVEYHVINLLTESGLKSLPLDSIAGIRLLNEKLDAELHQALEILATGIKTDKKTVSIRFSGQGRRPVRIGYIRETPIWKTSYRLVLNKDEEPFLQGWAIVENTTETDWENVALTLVSGRPISFRMDLYQPLYIDRPLVVPELYASLMPRSYGQDLGEKEVAFERAGRRLQRERLAELAAPAAKALADKNRNGVIAGAQIAGRGAGGVGGSLAEYDTTLSMAIRQTQSLAQAGEVGELFQYVIEMPVTLDRQKSAMLPIVNAPVKGEKVSIYNPSVGNDAQSGGGFFNVQSGNASEIAIRKHPLNGLRLTNSTDLHLMQGPITVFDEGTYAGDARIEDIAPKSSRLISYALDLETEVATESKSHPEEIQSVKLIKGVLYASRKYRRSTTYTVKNSGGKSETVLIEQPFEADWKLTEPEKPEEKTRDLYRFAVKAEPGKPAKLTVAEERTQSQGVQLTNIDDNTIRIYLRAEAVSPRVKQALQELIQRKHELSQLSAQRQQLEEEITAISQEQDRIRQNMAQLTRSTELYNRYVKKFGEQEDRIEKLRDSIEQLKTEQARKQTALDEYLMGLDIS